MRLKRLQPVVDFYLFTHCSPFLLARLVSEHVVKLGEEEDDNGQHIDCDEIAVATAVVGLVVGAVDEISRDVAELNAH